MIAHGRVHAYLSRPRAADWFDNMPTADCRVYAADPEIDIQEVRMFAVPCDCSGHTDGRHMAETRARTINLTELREPLTLPLSHLVEDC
jgi:hypothetical protein